MVSKDSSSSAISRTEFSEFPCWTVIQNIPSHVSPSSLSFASETDSLLSQKVFLSVICWLRNCSTANNIVLSHFSCDWRAGKGGGAGSRTIMELLHFCKLENEAWTGCKFELVGSWERRWLGLDLYVPAGLLGPQRCFLAHSVLWFRELQRWGGGFCQGRILPSEDPHTPVLSVVNGLFSGGQLGILPPPSFHLVTGLHGFLLSK
jgi:hypothetical protein